MSSYRSVVGGFLGALCLASFISTGATADTPREIAKRVSPSVVLLVMEDSNGQPLSMGSGFVVSQGVVATNRHVIEDAARGYAKFAGEKTKHDIRGIVASDPARDLVLLSIDGVKAALLPVGDSNEVAVGDTVYAVGNPRGLEGTFSAGIVSSIRKVGEDSLLQITAPISPGSSGGPVVNSKGEVIGVAVATFKGGQNLNFAIPSQYLYALVPLIKAPIALPEATKAARARKEKSILDQMGGKSTEGVTTAQFVWTYDTPQYGGSPFTFSIRNQLREPVRNVICIVVFYGNDGLPLDTALVTLEDPVLPGLAKRVEGRVDRSVHRLLLQDETRTRIEFRVLYFDILNSDEPLDSRSDGSPTLPIAPETPASNTPRQVDRTLAELERELAKIVAKFAPAGDGPDLIESNIKGEFKGWDGETIFILDSGQVWQQVTYAYVYHYSFRPKVWIVKSNGAYKMIVEGITDSIFVKQIEPEVSLLDRAGRVVAYLDLTDEMTIYMWSGKPVGYLSGKSVYGFNGQHLGWYADGVIYDPKGKIAAAKGKALPVNLAVAAPRGFKRFKPFKAFKQFAPFEPFHSTTWSDTPTVAFLLQGAK